jgi:hypothetical protein
MVAVFGFAPVKAVRDARHAYNSDRWDRSELLDLTTTTSASGGQ